MKYMNKASVQQHLYAMRVSEVFEQQFPYRGFFSWDTDALRNPAQAHSCDRYAQVNKLYTDINSTNSIIIKYTLA